MYVYDTVFTSIGSSATEVVPQDHVIQLDLVKLSQLGGEEEDDRIIPAWGTRVASSVVKSGGGGGVSLGDITSATYQLPAVPGLICFLSI